MKRFLNMMAVCCTVAVIGCASTTTTPATTVSPGAVGACGANCTKACCTKAKGDASLGALGEDSPRCRYKKNIDGNANLGVIGDEAKSTGRSGCCKGKKRNADASLGALGEDSPRCRFKKNIDGNTSLGVVGDKTSSTARSSCRKAKASKGSS